MKPIVIEVVRDVPSPAEVVFDVFMPMDLTTIMTGYGPLPAVSAIEDPSGPWDSVGTSRTIRLADGNSMLEVLTEVERPSHFSYSISKLTNVLRFLVSQFHGSWRFEPIQSEGGTQSVRATWRYEFEVRSSITRPISWVILTLFWRPYMSRAFDRAMGALPLSSQCRTTDVMTIWLYLPKGL